MESFSSASADNLFIECNPGEWRVTEIIAQNGEKTSIAEIRKDENKEFVVEKGAISYIGTWTIEPDNFEVKNEKVDQDHYMRINYKNVMTASALVSLP